MIQSASLSYFSPRFYYKTEKINGNFYFKKLKYGAPRIRPWLFIG